MPLSNDDLRKLVGDLQSQNAVLKRQLMMATSERDVLKAIIEHALGGRQDEWRRKRVEQPRELAEAPDPGSETHERRLQRIEIARPMR